MEVMTDDETVHPETSTSSDVALERRYSEKEEAFWRKRILPVEEKEVITGRGYRWFRSSNIDLYRADLPTLSTTKVVTSVTAGEGEITLLEPRRTPRKNLPIAILACVGHRVDYHQRTDRVALRRDRRCASEPTSQIGGRCTETCAAAANRKIQARRIDGRYSELAAGRERAPILITAVKEIMVAAGTIGTAPARGRSGIHGPARAGAPVYRLLRRAQRRSRPRVPAHR